MEHNFEEVKDMINENKWKNHCWFENIKDKELNACRG